MKKSEPWSDPPLKPVEASALAALHLGKADEGQQKAALDWILSRACRTFSDTFDPDPQLSAMQQGMRRAGLNIINAARTSPKAAAALEDLNNKDA